MWHESFNSIKEHHCWVVLKASVCLNPALLSKLHKFILHKGKDNISYKNSYNFLEDLSLHRRKKEFHQSAPMKLSQKGDYFNTKHPQSILRDGKAFGKTYISEC